MEGKTGRRVVWTGLIRDWFETFYVCNTIRHPSGAVRYAVGCATLESRDKAMAGDLIRETSAYR